MTRDFSERQKQNLLNMVKEVQPDGVFQKVTDWFGDGYLHVKKFFGGLDINKYLDDMSAYHRQMIDKDDVSAQKIEMIFTDSLSVDSKTGSELYSNYLFIDSFNSLLSEYCHTVMCDDPHFCSQALLQTLQTTNLKDYEGRSKYIQYDVNTGTYVYNWTNITELMHKTYPGQYVMSSADNPLPDNNFSIPSEDVALLTFILSTLTDSNGVIDTDNLQKFITAGYRQPVYVTDYGESFDTIMNGDKVPYNYLENKSYMSESLKEAIFLYSQLCECMGYTGNQNNLNSLMQTVVENYPVIEWRLRLSLNDFEKTPNAPGGGLVKAQVLQKFNHEICKPSLEISYVDTRDGSGLDYYLITSSAQNIGNVITAQPSDINNPHGVNTLWRKNNSEKDGFSDCTIRFYVDCTNANSDVVATVLQDKSIIASYYQDFDLIGTLQDDVTKKLLGEIPGVGDALASVYELEKDLADQLDSGKIKGADLTKQGVDTVKSIDLNKVSNVSKARSKQIKGRLNAGSYALGLYSKYRAVETNNKKVAGQQQAMDENAKNIMVQKSLGIEYNNMVVKYDHAPYSEKAIKGTTIQVDKDKICDKCTDVEIQFKNLQYNENLLRHQYDTIMHTSVSDKDFEALEQQVDNYLQTGKADGKLLKNYLKELGV